MSKLQQNRAAFLCRSGRGTLDIANYYGVEEHVVANGLPHWRGTAKTITGLLQKSKARNLSFSQVVREIVSEKYGLPQHIKRRAPQSPKRGDKHGNISQDT